MEFPVCRATRIIGRDMHPLSGIDMWSTDALMQTSRAHMSGNVRRHSGIKSPMREITDDSTRQELQCCTKSMLIEHSASLFFGNHVLVLHFPGMVHGVKSGVPNQEPERPFRYLSG